MAAENVKQFVELFGSDPLLQKMPLPASVREAMGLEKDPEPAITPVKDLIQKAIASQECDTFEIRQCPDVPLPDFEKMAEEYRKMFLVFDAPESKIEMIEEEGSAATADDTTTAKTE